MSLGHRFLVLAFWLRVTLVPQVAFILYGEAFIRQVPADYRAPQDRFVDYLLSSRDARQSDYSDDLLRALSGCIRLGLTNRYPQSACLNLQPQALQKHPVR